MPRAYKLTPEGREARKRKVHDAKEAEKFFFQKGPRLGPKDPNPVPIKTLAEESGLKYFKGRVW